jgi:hypothetical protein
LRGVVVARRPKTGGGQCFGGALYKRKPRDGILSWHSDAQLSRGRRDPRQHSKILARGHVEIWKMQKNFECVWGSCLGHITKTGRERAARRARVQKNPIDTSAVNRNLQTGH